MKTTLLSLLLLLASALSAQTPDFTAIDAHARALRNTSANVGKLTDAVTKPCKTDLEKVRAIFVWITDNIAYDCQERNKLVKNPYVSIDEKMKQVETTLRSHDGVCDDYAALFKAMCEHAGLEAAVISGWSKSLFDQIGWKLPEHGNHAWNAVRIDGQWRLLDVTWASGSADCVENQFVKKFYGGYFLSNPEAFVMTHLPKDSSWQLLPKPVSAKTFAYYPLLHANALDYGVQGVSPQNGVLRATAAGLRLAVSMPRTTRLLFLIADDKLIEITPTYENGQYVFEPKLEKTPKMLSVAVENDKGYFEHMVSFRLVK